VTGNLTLPAPMRLIMTAAQVAADRPAWLARRIEDPDTGEPMVGASDIGPIMALEGGHGSGYGLWMEKTGRAKADEEPPPVAAFGSYCENFTTYLFQQRRPDLHVTPGGMYCSAERPWAFATFDRFAHAITACDPTGWPVLGCPGDVPPDTTVQLKTGAYRDWREEGMPLAYRAQVIWEMRVGGFTRGLIPLLDRAAGDLDGVWEIVWDENAEADYALMLEAAENFRDLVKRDVPPKVDGLPATTRALIQRYSDLDETRRCRVPWRLAVRWRRASLAESKAKARRKLYENQLRALAGVAGIWVTWDPDTGAEIKVATHRASPRAGYSVAPVERVDTVYPSRKFTPRSH
jgi:predicted phage-related endonuclease